MSFAVDYFKDGYEKLSNGTDPEIDNWVLMKSPGLLYSIVIGYLVFVIKLGPDYMKTKKPMQLKNTLILYNGFQILFSLFLVYKASLVDIPVFSLFSEKCNNKWMSKENQNAALVVTWYYAIAKATELLDTLFFIMRKKMNQVTFLHVYHHASMLLFTWHTLKHFFGGQIVVIILINSAVHVVMYTYYLISGLGPEYQKYIWWKKYITKMQLIQFCIVIVYMVLTIFSKCNFLLGTTYFFTADAVLFFYLFSLFYQKSYVKKAE